jgi:hypothetical protein
MEISITTKPAMHRKEKLTFWRPVPSLWRGWAGWSQPPRLTGDSIDQVHGHTSKYENIIYGYVKNASEMKMIVT